MNFFSPLIVVVLFLARIVLADICGLSELVDNNARPFDVQRLHCKVWCCSNSLAFICGLVFFSCSF